MPKPAEQALLRVRQPTTEHCQPAPVRRPHLLRADEHAGIVLGLNEDLDPPSSRCLRRLAVVIDAVVANLRCRQTKARAERALRRVLEPGIPPSLERLGELGKLTLLTP